MKKNILFALLLSTFLSGCVVYAEPIPYSYYESTNYHYSPPRYYSEPVRFYNQPVRYIEERRVYSKPYYERQDYNRYYERKDYHRHYKHRYYGR